MKDLHLGTNNVSNAEYHGDKKSLSSSNLKLLLQDPQAFYEEKILGIKENKTIPAFVEGSYVHSLILEPEKTEEEFAVYPGLRKQGADFEQFKIDNKGKEILSKPQELRCRNYIKAYKKLKEARDLLKNTKSEYTIVTEFDDIRCKMRADAINVEQGYIVDVKTTSFGSDIDSFRGAVNKFCYDLSAAFYVDIAARHFDKPFDFYFITISKTDLTCDVYKASFKTLTEGRKKYKEALHLYKVCQETGKWQRHDLKNKKKRKERYVILEI